MKIIGKLGLFWCCNFMQRVEQKGNAVLLYNREAKDPKVIYLTASILHFFHVNKDRCL